MKKLLMALTLIAGLAGVSEANFRSERDRLLFSSFTNTADLNVVITSAPAQVYCVTFGTNIANGYVAFYDRNLFTSNVTTVAYLSADKNYCGDFTLSFSSGLMYVTNMAGLKATILWDWFKRPTYK